MTTVILETTLGNIDIELNTEQAPITAQNFINYVQSGHYDGTIFHRVIKGFMIQAGGFSANMSEQKTKDPITNEANNDLQNQRGTIAMARTMEPHSATAQFFINLVDNAFLNHTSQDMHGWGYCVFGKVIAGLDVVDAIAAVDTGNKAGHQDVPITTITIQKAFIK